MGLRPGLSSTVRGALDDRIHWKAPLVSGCIRVGCGNPFFAIAQNAPLVPVEVHKQNGYTRLLFDWRSVGRANGAPEHTATIENNVLVIRFDRPLSIDMEALGVEAEEHIALMRQDSDGKTLRFALKTPVDVLSNEDDYQFAIDLVPVGGTANHMPFIAPETIELLDDIVVAAERREPPTEEELVELASAPKEIPASAPRLPIRVIRNDSRSRVVFQWPEKVGYDVAREGDTLVVSFNQVARPKLARLRVDPPALVKTADAVQRFGGLEVRIDVENHADFGHFRQDDDIVLDIFAKVGAEPSQEFIAEEHSEEVGEIQVAEVDTHGEDHETASEEVHASTAEGEVVPLDHETVSNTPENEEQAHEETKPAHQSVIERVDGTINVGLFQKDEGVEVNFPWGRDVAAGIFRRGDYLWAIFDAEAKLDLSEFSRGSFYEISGLEEMSLDGGTFVRFELGPRALVTVRQEHHGWRILLGETAFGETESLELLPRIGDHGIAEMTVDLPSANSVHLVTDPEIGDDIFVVTALGPAQGLVAARKFVDFFTVASAHGVAIQPLAEDLDVGIEDGVVIIRKPAGLAVTGAKTVGAEMIAQQEVIEDANKEPEEARQYNGFRKLTADHVGIVEFVNWRGDEELGYYGNLADLNQRLARTPSRARSDRRLELARFYFSHSLLSEALGALEIIASDDPAYTNQGAYVALKGATLQRMERHEDALKTLKHFSVKNDPGAALWRGLALQALGRHKKARDDIGVGMKELDRYPREWQAYFQMVETQAALGVNDLADATIMWDNIRMDALADEHVAEAYLTKGQILDRTGDAALALDYFRKVYPLTDGEMAYRARYHEIDMLYRVGELTADNAIDRLERLRYQWRGDDLELRAIQGLGEIYIDQHQYREALTVMKAGFSFNPQHMMSRTMRVRMDEVFEELYLNGAADKLKPAEAISLYYDFKELTPIGAKGDRMIRRLSERLVSIGLLDQAAELLDHQVKYRLKGTARAQVAMRLALIQLRNKRPEDAFHAVSSTRYAGLTPKLRGQRRLIEARALSDMGRHNHAIEVLEDDLSREAQVLRANIYWDGDNWPETGKAYEALLDKSWGGKEPLTNHQRSEVMRMAISYALVEDVAALDRVRQKFGKQMSKSADARAFEIATGDMVSQGVAFRDVLRRVNATNTFEAFMADFKTRFGEDGAMVN